jgi:hypothetical protein
MVTAGGPDFECMHADDGERRAIAAVAITLSQGPDLACESPS